MPRKQGQLTPVPSCLRSHSPTGMRSYNDGKGVGRPFQSPSTKSTKTQQPTAKKAKISQPATTQPQGNATPTDTPRRSTRNATNKKTLESMDIKPRKDTNKKETTHDAEQEQPESQHGAGHPEASDWSLRAQKESEGSSATTGATPVESTSVVSPGSPRAPATTTDHSEKSGDNNNKSQPPTPTTPLTSPTTTTTKTTTTTQTTTSTRSNNSSDQQQ